MINQGTSDDYSKPDRTLHWYLISGLVALITVLYVGTVDEAMLTSLFTRNPSQAFLFSVLFSTFALVFSVFFNSLIQLDRSKQNRQLRKDMMELKTMIFNQTSEIQALSGHMPESSKPETKRDEAATTQLSSMPENQPDKRLKMIEIILTLGGFLGIIISLQKDMLIPVAQSTFSVLIVLFIFFAFLAYSAITIPLKEKNVKLFLWGLSTVFSGLLALAITIPFTNQSNGFIVLLTPYIGNFGAIILYLAFVIISSYQIYIMMSKIVMRSFEKMAPVQNGDADHSQVKPLLNGAEPKIHKVIKEKKDD